MPYHKDHYRRGYTLVEISAVVVVVGLIIGGIMTGASLRRNAQLQSIMDQESQLLQATLKFRDIYHGWPGDLWNATSVFGTTAPDGNPVNNGNGNGLWDNNDFAGIGQHLVLAGLLNGSYNGVAYSTKNIIIGPLANSEFFGSTTAGAYPVNYFEFDGVQDFNHDGVIAPGQESLLSILTPAEALRIDQKYDDGVPNTGRLYGENGQNVTGANTCLNGAIYNLSNNNVACVLLFMVDTKF